ncbi:MAG: dihydrofolate reductase [Defluviitaleaceae bacterium]|nr:dihydrofolate reductase [Defluviitaleaceae bacterium]
MNLIAAVSSEWGIGRGNDLLFRIREDHLRFKSLTIGKVVVMGHNTFKSLPKQQPLVDRANIVLSRDESLVIPGVVMCNSLEHLRDLLTPYAPEDIFIIGGEKIYTQLLEGCTIAHITKVASAPPADVFFPNLDALPEWRLVEESEEKSHRDLKFKYCTYKKC